MKQLTFHNRDIQSLDTPSSETQSSNTLFRTVKAITLSALLAAPLTIIPTVDADAAGLLKPVNSNLPELSIREHHINVVMENSYAVTSVEQVFHNPNNQPLEAIYSFPVPDKAAVGEFTYWIDGQPVTGEVVEKQRARNIYQQEKQAGREAALVEQDSYKTFDISVTPVKANSDVRIKLVYIQPAHVDSGIGRYLYPLEDGGVDEQKNAFWSRKEVVDEKFSFNMKVRSGYPIDSVRLPQHSGAQIQQISNSEWQISINNQAASLSQGAADQSQSNMQNDDHQTQSVPNSSTQSIATGQPAATLDEDILVYWRHAEGLPGGLDMVTYKEASDKAGTFMLTLTPGDDLAPVQGNRDWIFVLDVSGSMQGKYSTLVDGVRQGLAKLPSGDRFRIVLFNDRTEDFSQGFQPVSKATVGSLLNKLEQYPPNRGTNLYGGIAEGLKDLDADRSTAMILVTDGVANVGVTEKKRFLELLGKNDIRLFTFVMGNSANRPLLNGMTEASNGFAISVSNADDIVGQLMLATSKLNHQALRDVEIHFEGGRVTDLTPEQIGSVYRGEQLTVMGHYRKPGPVKVTLTGTAGAEQRSYTTEITLPEQNQLNPELNRLWAFASIENLQNQIDYLGDGSDGRSDDSSEQQPSEVQDARQAITDLALQYDLVTDYTSMLVVRDKVFQQQNISRDNTARVQKEQQARKQRAKQPATSNRADNQQPMFDQNHSRATLGGGSSGGSGAIGHWVLLIIGSLLLIHYRNRRRENDSDS
ncbi:MAG: VIT and VWA domain-containing protein [Amphritea sp.]|nr:VIT and VWA domain-containing protein [Amphritea sp.]